MNKRISGQLTFIGAILTVALGLYLVSFHSYILFHSLIEITTIAICFTLFILTWNARAYLSNNYLKIIGIGYAFIALIDLIHTLAYKGMNIFPGYGSNLPTQLWIVARYLQAVTLCAAPFFMERRLNNRAVIGGYAVAVAVLVAIVFTGRFPDCYIEGEGLTPFKVISEYAITAILFAASYFLYLKRDHFNRSVFLFTITSIACVAVSEITFTAYLSVYGFANLIGHFLKLAAFYLIYRAILVTGFKEPFDLIFRELKQAEEALQKARDNLEKQVSERTADLEVTNRELEAEIAERQQAEEALEKSSMEIHDLYNRAPCGYHSLDKDGRFVRINDTELQWLGYRRDEIIGKKTFSDLITERGLRTYQDTFPRFKARGWIRDLEFEMVRKDGSILPVLLSATAVIDENGDFVMSRSTVYDISARIRAEKMRKLLSTIVDSSDDAIISKDLNGTILSWNKGAQRIYGYAAEEVIGKSISLIIPPEKSDEPHSIVELLAPGEGVKHIDTERIRKDGSRLFVSLAVAPLYDAGGNIFGASIIARDITERRQAEMNLRRLNRELRAISDCNQTLLRAVDEQTLLNDICRIICDVAGYRMAWVGYVEHDDAKTIRPVAWAGVENGYLTAASITWGDTEYGCGPTGTAIRNGKSSCVQDFATDSKLTLWREHALQRGYRSSIALPLRDGNAVIFGVLNIYSMEPDAFTPDEVRLLEELAGDLAFGIDTLRIRAERKKADEALQKTGDLLRTIIEAAPTAIIGLDLEGMVQAVWNPAAEKMLGWSAQEAMGRFLPSVPEDKEEEFRRFREWVRSGKRLAGVEVRRRRRDGTPIEYSIYASPLHDPEGKIIGNIAVLVDITEHRRKEEDQEKLQAQFLQAQKMESVGRLAGGVAHDFNNMLGVILGHTEVALAHLDPTQPLFANLEGIHKATERSIDLTRQLLAFARKQTVAPQVLDLSDTVEGMLKILRRLIGEDIDLTWLPGAGGWPIKVDPSQIDQILANLCVNARDAISGVGKVTIETHTAIFDEAYCAVNPGFLPGEYMLLAVSDNGCGMDKDTMDKLFEPFFTTKEMGKGTGLGLATVYGIVKQNNGFINVYSEPGKGTTFKIYLPRHAGPSEQIKEKKTAMPAARGDETILLVEDEPDMLRMIKMILERLGYSVLAAKTPGEAIRLAEDHAGRIHLLMTDVVMPEMNGRDLTNKMLSRYPDLKGLFMSGYTADVIAHHGMLDEGVHFIQKPFSIKDLATKVREVLGDRKKGVTR